MKAKRILSIAIIAALPFGANSANISGAMYVAPAAADTNHPAPTTNANAPYGRIDIDTADQDHIASTAYVKGAYNSAIAAINKATDFAINVAVGEAVIAVSQQGYADSSALELKQEKLVTTIDGQDESIDPYVEQMLSEQALTIPSSKAVRDAIDDIDESKQNKFILVNNQSSEVSEYVLDKPEFSNSIRNGYIASMVLEDDNLVTAGAVADVFASQRATIYTTWDTNATTQVPLTFVPAQQ